MFHTWGGGPDQGPEVQRWTNLICIGIDLKIMTLHSFNEADHVQPINLYSILIKCSIMGAELTNGNWYQKKIVTFLEKILI